MAELLAGLRTAVLNAAQQAMGELQAQMIVESYGAIESFQWNWEGPISDERPIIDTGNLMNSLDPSGIQLKQNSISFSLTWDPVDPETGKHYGELVHDGQAGYFVDDEGGDFAHDYTARPWTFLLIPAEQRDEELLNTDTGPTPESLPEDGWEAGLQAFQRTFAQELSRQFKVVQ